MTILAIVVAAVGTVLDILSSRAALRAGAREIVPLSRLLGGSWWWVRALATAGVAVAVWFVPEAALALLLVGIASAAVAVNNWRIATG